MRNEAIGHTPIPDDGDSLFELQRYVNWIAISLVPVTGAYVYSSVMSGSLSMVALTFYWGIAFFVNLFTVIAVRSIVRKNIYSFPYGTGKLENFIGFLTGIFMLPVAATIYFSVINSFLSERQDGRYEFTQIAMVAGLLRDTVFLIWSKRLIRKSISPSPIVQSFYVGYKVSVRISIAGIFSMLLALWLTTMNCGHMATMVDLVLAFVLATYMAVNAVILVRTHFRSLIDLPLAETDQLKILRVLSSRYHSFDNLGTIYTRTCGNTKIIEIELYFKRSTSMEEIHVLGNELLADFKTLFTDTSFKLIPIMD